MKKLIQLFAITAALALLLCACGTNDAEPGTSDTNPPSSTAEPTTDNTELASDAPSEETIATLPADPDALVSDMYRDVYENDSPDSPYPIAVPRVNLDGAEVEDLNELLYRRFVAGTEEGFWRGYQMTYRYHTTDNGLLTLILENYFEGDSYPVEYSVYTIRLSDGHILTREEVLEAAGLSEAEFDEAASVAMGHAYCNFLFPAIEAMVEEQRNSLLPGGGEWDFVQEQFSQTVSAKNVAEAVPYFEEDGTLAVRSYIYQIAGATYHEELVPLTNYTPSEYYETLVGSDAE